MNIRKLLFASAICFLMAGSLPAQSYLGNFTSYSSNGNVVTIHADTAAITLMFYRPNIVRVDYLPSPSSRIPRSIVVIPDSNQQVAVTVTNDDSALVMTTSALNVICQKYPLRLTFRDAGNRLLVGEPDSGGLISYGAQRLANFAIQPTEHFYGTGERGTSLDLRGLNFDSFNEQHGGYPTGGMPATMNVNIPFIVSSNHYGIYFDDTYKGYFNIGSSDPNILGYIAYGGELSYYLIYDPTYTGILSDYTWLTGRAPLLPKWAYGYIQSKYGYRNYQAAEQTIQTFRADTIPCDAIVLDLYWFANMGDLDWNTAAWPNPSQITSQFLSQGFKTIVITEPYITANSLNYQTAGQQGYFAKNQTGQNYTISNWWSCGCDAGLLDITNPAAQSWWWSKYQHIFNTGVSGLWTDLGEPERDYTDMQFYMGPDLEVHNVYDFLWARTLFDGFNNSFPNRRLFNLTRSGYAGIQRFGTVTWSGDVAKTFSGLAVQLPLLLNMGMSGIVYHNSDIGGFTGSSPTTPELYTRWMEFGAFCPLMRAHGYDGLGGTEPWVFGDSTEGIVRKMIDLRYSLLPYNYTMAYESYKTGVPLARPLVLEYPDDPNVTNESSAYMWGDDFLVAPVVQSGQTSQTFYLPQGKWIDYWNDKVYNGGTSIAVDAPINEVPLFVKAGSIIPMQPVMQYVGQYPADTIMLSIYPDPGIASSFTMYEDDGTSLDYQSGAFAETTFEDEMTTAGSGGANVLNIFIGQSLGNYAGKRSSRVYICEVHKISYDPAAVQIGSLSLNRAGSGDSLENSKTGFYYNKASGVLFIKMSASSDSAYSIRVDSVEVTGVKKPPVNPSGYRLNQNYPNPFNPSTTISYRLPGRSFVTLKVYDVLGREVQTLVSGEESAGEHTIMFDGNGLSSGVYIYRLTAGLYRESREMLLLK